jgi:hypothetical protein
VSTDLPPISSSVPRFVWHAQVRIRHPGRLFVSGRKLQRVTLLSATALPWRDKIHQVNERRDQRRLGAPRKFGERGWQAAAIALFLVEIIAGRNGPTGGPKNRPSLPRGPPLHHHHYFDDRKGGAVSSAPSLGSAPAQSAEALSGRAPLFTGGRNSINRAGHSPFRDALLLPAGYERQDSLVGRSVVPMQIQPALTHQTVNLYQWREQRLPLIGFNMLPVKTPASVRLGEPMRARFIDGG